MPELPQRRRLKRFPMKRVEWEDIPVPYEHAWEREITEDMVHYYADLSEDYCPWYGPGDSPFGDPVAPPLLISRLCGSTIMEDLGRMWGYLNTYNRSVMLAPIHIGMRLRFHGSITDKFVKRGRRYIHQEIDVFDAETGQPVFRESKEYLVSYQKVEE